MSRKDENSSFQNLPGLSVSKVKPELETKQFIILDDLPESPPKIEAHIESINQVTKTGTTTIIKTPRKPITIAPKIKPPVKILPKTPIMSSKVTPGNLIIEPRKVSSPIKIVPRPSNNPPYDIHTIQKFSTAWRCSICQKISSTKIIALAHLKVAHSKVQKQV